MIGQRKEDTGMRSEAEMIFSFRESDRFGVRLCDAAMVIRSVGSVGHFSSGDSWVPPGAVPAVSALFSGSGPFEN